MIRERVLRPDAYPYTIPCVLGIDGLQLSPAVTILIGENGSGKSTVVEAVAIAAGFNPEGGSKNLRFASLPSESDLKDALRLVRGARRERGGFFLRAESVFNLATQVNEQGLAAYGWQNLHELSHGEAFLWAVAERFRPEGLYILDEPEAALSPQRQLVLLQHIHRLVSGGSQLLIATHSPILMAYPGALLYELGPWGVRPVAYEDTEHYQLTRAFLQDPGRFTSRLFSEE